MVIAKGLMLDITFPYILPNGLTEITTMVVQTLVMRTNLLISAWGDAISHTTMLISLRPTATQCISALQLVTGYKYFVLTHIRVSHLCANCTATAPMVGPYK